MNALILVDIQNDFLPGGALAVPDGGTIIPLVNQLMSSVPLVVATQDWHPADHGSFAASHPGQNPFALGELAGLPQVLWPAHCVEGTPGAAFAPTLATWRIDRVFPKGTAREIDSYSGFFDNGHRRATGLGDYLRGRGVAHVFVVGLATDYCVKFTALDARALGLEVTLIEDACRGVNLTPGDVDRAIEEMRAAGVMITQTRALLEERAVGVAIA